MPELPEVETVKNGLKEVLGFSRRKLFVERVKRKRKDLRAPMPAKLESLLPGSELQDIRRRAKYLIFEFPHGYLINHLGMTGVWRSLKGPYEKHDHFVLGFSSGETLVFNDPRRFGLIDWVEDLEKYKRFQGLGPEPLSDGFDAAFLYPLLKKRKAPVKSVLMDQKIVVGVGNIYASELLYRAGLRPQRRSDKITAAECERIVGKCKEVLREAIAAGGSTISDFQNAGGESGYFQHQFRVYGHAGKPCLQCRKPILMKMLGGRSSFYCSSCQK